MVQYPESLVVVYVDGNSAVDAGHCDVAVDVVAGGRGDCFVRRVMSFLRKPTFQRA